MGEAGRVGGLPGPEEQHLHPGLQCGPHLQAWPHILVPCKGTACLPSPSQLRSRAETLGPRGSWSSCFAFLKGSCQSQAAWAPPPGQSRPAL